MKCSDICIAAMAMPPSLELESPTHKGPLTSSGLKKLHLSDITGYNSKGKGFLQFCNAYMKHTI